MSSTALRVHARRPRASSASRRLHHRADPHPSRMRAFLSRARVGTRCIQDARAVASSLSLARGATADASVSRDKAYVDRRRVRAIGGSGGGGCASFARDGGTRRRRGADGGDGGRGGDVVARACARTKGLGDVRNLLRGGKGGSGGSQGRIGSRGEDVEARVPIGTVVWRETATGDAEAAGGVDTSNWGTSRPISWSAADEADGEDDAPVSNEREGVWTRPRGLGRGVWEVVADLTEDGQTCVLARGGRGGRGNKRMPVGKEAGTREPGLPGDEGSYVLELKSVADVGLVGLPNAGKSTLLRALSNATPRVASYAFTTMQPQLGAIERSNGTSVTVADIPGLIEGAHENRGLGHNFLRHVERCEAFVYVVDLSSGDGVKPWDALDILKRELDEYLPGLSNRPSVIVATKMDLPNTSKTLKALRERVKPTRVLAVSAAKSEGTDEILRAIDEFKGDDGWK